MDVGRDHRRGAVRCVHNTGELQLLGSHGLGLMHDRPSERDIQERDALLRMMNNAVHSSKDFSFFLFRLYRETDGRGFIHRHSPFKRSPRCVALLGPCCWICAESNIHGRAIFRKRRPCAFARSCGCMGSYNNTARQLIEVYSGTPFLTAPAPAGPTN